MQIKPYLPGEVEILERIEETPTLFTLRLRFTDPAVHASYTFAPGQFNMVYLYGVGEVPISIVSDPEDEHILDHTIRAVGRVTRGFARLRAGDRLGIRGPYGRGWPMAEAEGHDVVLVTGGLGCAPVVSVVNYIVRRRSRFGRVNIVQGVKHADDLIWREQYERWARLPDTKVLLTADAGGPLWPWHIGPVTNLFDTLEYDPEHCIVMMCGPEGMMRAVIGDLRKHGVPEDAMWMSMERSMQCAVGHCGHCQHGGRFVCRQGPVFCYPEVKEVFGIRGF